MLVHAASIRPDCHLFVLNLVIMIPNKHGGVPNRTRSNSITIIRSNHTVDPEVNELPMLFQVTAPTDTIFSPADTCLLQRRAESKAPHDPSWS